MVLLDYQLLKQDWPAVTGFPLNKVSIGCLGKILKPGIFVSSIQINTYA
jgi:hypothetical protein